MKLYVTSDDLPMYTIVSDTNPVPPTLMTMSPSTSYSSRYEGYYVSNPINIIGVNFVGRTDKSYTLSVHSSCISWLELQNDAGVQVTSTTFNMDFTVYDFTVVSTFRIQLRQNKPATFLSMCIVLSLTSPTAVINPVSTSYANQLSYLPSFSIGLVDTKLVSLSEEKAVLSEFSLTYELNIILPKDISLSTGIVFAATLDDNCFCPVLSDALLVTSDATPYGQKQPTVGSNCSFSITEALIEVYCSSSVPELNWFSFNLVCASIFSAETLHKCVPDLATKSIKMSFDGGAAVDALSDFYNAGPEVFLSARYIRCQTNINRD